MRFKLLAFSFVLAGASVHALQKALQDGCPKDEYACQDIINSSQCIEQLVLENLAPLTKEAMVKCVVFQDSVTNITGEAK
ncbi:hypothetical protein LSUE1_G005181, partial [Lachnellula suecica]